MSLSNEKNIIKSFIEEVFNKLTAFRIIAVHDVFDNIQRLEGGMFYQRMHLWATSNGLAMQPMNQMTE